MTYVTVTLLVAEAVESKIFFGILPFEIFFTFCIRVKILLFLLLLLDSALRLAR